MLATEHYSVIWAVGQTSPYTAITFLAVKPVPNYTACWHRQMCVNNLPRVVTCRQTRFEVEPVTLQWRSPSHISHTGCLTVNKKVHVNRAHSFPRATEFRAEPQNLPFSQNFDVSVEFHKISQRLRNDQRLILSLASWCNFITEGDGKI